MNKLLRILLPLVEKEVASRVLEIQIQEEKALRRAQEKAKAPIEKAFKVGGIQYYELKDLFNQNCLRSFAAISFYEELRMKCSREYLLEHIKASEELLKQGKDGTVITNGKLDLDQTLNALREINQLNLQLKERLEMIFEPDCMMKLAGIVFFDDTEGPLDYDQGYGIEKVNRWKKQEVDGFFLSKHMKDLVDYTSINEKDFQKYTEMADLMTKEHLGSISTILSKTTSMKELSGIPV